ncbi:hypothetical protein NLG97_g5772 [Lecanicillium saksenae]|uniref:Uncharacterized protein n=1 Tax=Lecanicillium saksenae TaxID=468837 RepID=A0ACC1QUP0_9HYPO|nr:hypothetical protein NLG97_g5772 [Lecanicillium saksenae]
MRYSALLSLCLLPGTWASPRPARRGVTCSFSIAAAAGDTCDSFCQSWNINLETFKSLNPDVQCPNLEANKDYCVDGTVTPGGPTTSPTTPSTTSKPITTTSSPSGTAPSPTQDGLAKNCDKFHYVAKGDLCSTIESKYGISAEQFSTWNPAIDSVCSNLWAGYYVCVHVPGAAITTPSTPTSTRPPNGHSTANAAWNG